MHIGNLRTALYAYLFAKKNGGEFILRLEDTDAGRFKKGTAEIIYNTLRDVGIEYTEGPDVGGPCGPYIQSQRKAIYREYAQKLIDLGGAYYCFCDKERLQKLHESGAAKYDKHCLSLPKTEIDKRLAGGEPFVIRQNIPETGATTYTDLNFGDITIDNKDLEDNILIKSDGFPTYNFANVADDRLMGITYVIRGIEYLSSTPKYNHIYRAFGWDIPKYIHLQPIMRDAKKKLSKRHGDASYEDLLKKGYLKEAIINYIALLGWNPKSTREKFSLAELTEAFSLDGVSKSPSIFDETKLRWLNSQYVKELSREEYRRFALPWYELSAAKGNRFDYNLIDALLHTRTEAFSDIPRLLSFIDNFEGYDLNLFANEKNKTDIATARVILPDILGLLKTMPEKDWNNAELFRVMSAFAETKGIKKAALFWLTRIALSGAASTPGGATELAELFGKEMTLARMQYSIDYLTV